MSEKYKEKICAITCSQHDNLVAEVERLKKENETHKKVICGFEGSLFKKAGEINQLKEAVKKCDPYKIEFTDDEECNLCGSVGQEYVCNFCENELSEGHKPNCEYIKLIGGEGE